MLAVGLWPLDFSPKNQVTWLEGEKGLRFRGEGVIEGRTVGGYVSTEGRPRRWDAGQRGFSIELWLRSSEDSKGGVPRFLSFVDNSGKVVLLLGQWRSSLIIRRPVPGYDVREKWKEIGVKVLGPGFIEFVGFVESIGFLVPGSGFGEEEQDLAGSAFAPQGKRKRKGIKVW